MSQVSIAEAKNHLPRIVQQAEAGEAVHITRRGKPVAVLLSDSEYARLTEPRQGFADFAQEWRKNMVARGIEFPSDQQQAGRRGSQRFHGACRSLFVNRRQKLIQPRRCMR